MFTTSPEFYTRNLKDAAAFNASPARIGGPGGSIEPGIVLKHNRAIRAVMPVSEARRLSHEIETAIKEAENN